jgi:O-antigen/teichoic acid export membrane protein
MIKKVSGLYIGIVLKLILSLLTDRYIAVNLSPEFYGTFKYYVTLITILSTVTGLGINVGIVRELSGQADSIQKQKKVLMFSIFFSFCASLICFLFCNNRYILEVLGIDFVQEFQLISLGIIAITLNKLFLAILSLKGNVKVKVIINDLLQPVILFGGIFLLNNPTLQNIILVFIFSQFLICVINIIVFYNSFASIIKCHDWKSASIRTFVFYCIPVFLTNILIVFSIEIDKLVLSALISKTSLGVYYAVAVLSNLLSLILGTLVFYIYH